MVCFPGTNLLVCYYEKRRTSAADLYIASSSRVRTARETKATNSSQRSGLEYEG